jgi:hypothetical protein
LVISPEDRAALNDPNLKAPSSRLAYKLQSSSLVGQYAGEAWAARKGIEMLEPAKY